MTKEEIFWGKFNQGLLTKLSHAGRNSLYYGPGIHESLCGKAYSFLINEQRAYWKMRRCKTCQILANLWELSQ